MGFDVTGLTSGHPDFWRLIGPFLGSRQVAREIGGTVWDDPGKAWFCAVAPDGEVAGICAAMPGGKVTVYQSDYVRPEYRRQGVYRALCEVRAAAFPGRARAVCTAASLPHLTATGFRAVRAKGSFTVAERDATGADPVPAAPLLAAVAGDRGIPVGEAARAMFARLADIPPDERIDVINGIRQALSEYSPMNREPVDCVLWLRQDQVHANAYNPNVVAPAEMRLLTLSVLEDGYTQPVVAWPDGEGSFEIVDGFHRNRVAREAKAVRKRVRGRLPVAVINPDRGGTGDRMAATIRHNRARGVHAVDGMSAIVIDLSRRNHSDKWIGEQLGMEPDEVLRLKQVQAMAELFADREFSEAWEAS